MQKVTIKVSPLGDVKIDAEGFVGNTCDNATKVFEEAFAGRHDRQNKPEYYDSNTQNEAQKLTF